MEGRSTYGAVPAEPGAKEAAIPGLFIPTQPNEIVEVWVQ